MLHLWNIPTIFTADAVARLYRRSGTRVPHEHRGEGISSRPLWHDTCIGWRGVYGSVGKLRSSPQKHHARRQPVPPAGVGMDTRPSAPTAQ
jgi:hypothetical protein